MEDELSGLRFNDSSCSLKRKRPPKIEIPTILQEIQPHKLQHATPRADSVSSGGNGMLIRTSITLFIPLNFVLIFIIAFLFRFIAKTGGCCAFLEFSFLLDIYLFRNACLWCSNKLLNRRDLFLDFSYCGIYKTMTSLRTLDPCTSTSFFIDFVFFLEKYSTPF